MQFWKRGGIFPYRQLAESQMHLFLIPKEARCLLMPVESRHTHPLATSCHPKMRHCSSVHASLHAASEKSGWGHFALPFPSGPRPWQAGACLPRPSGVEASAERSGRSCWAGPTWWMTCSLPKEGGVRVQILLPETPKRAPGELRKIPALLSYRGVEFLPVK